MTDAKEQRWLAQDAQGHQVAAAMQKLHHPGTGVSYGFPALDDVAGEIQCGEVDFLAAASGQGKSTAVRSIIERAIARGVRVIIGGFEMGSESHRTALAAMACDVDPGDILSNDWLHWPTEKHLAAFKRLEATLADMQNPPWDCLHFVDRNHVTPDAIKEIGDMAVALESHSPQGTLCIVDHIDHLGPDGERSYGASVAVTSAVHSHAKQYGTRWLVTTQLHNRTMSGGGDRLARHKDISPEAIKNGQHKEEVATRIFGLYRPLRGDATPDELKAVVAKKAELSTVLSKNISMLNCIKHRHHGNRVGTRITLGWEHGRLTDLPDDEARALEAQREGIHTSTGMP